MKQTYTAYYYSDIDEDGEHYHAEVPALGLSVDIPEGVPLEDFTVFTSESLSEALYLYELEGESFPEDSAYSPDDGYAFALKIEADTEAAARRIVSVKKIDIDES